MQTGKWTGIAVAAGLALFHSACYAGPEVLGAPGSTEGAPDMQTPVGAPAEAGIPYNEYFNYSAFARRSYAPGYTPHATSLFENPREYPTALCVMATPYYMYAGIHGWFFGSPRGYQSSVPPNSHALAYFRGELGITSNLRYGYPHGLRAIEPIVIPFNSYAERGGVFITGGGLATAEIAAQEAQAEVPAAPTPLPAPGSNGGSGQGTMKRGTAQLEKGTTTDAPPPVAKAARVVPTPGPGLVPRPPAARIY